MFPINGIISGTLFSATSRLIRGEFQVSEEAQKRLNEVRDKVEEMSQLVGDLSVTAPGTWGRFAGRFLDHSFQTSRRFESVKDALDGNDFTTALAMPSFLVTYLIEECEKVRLFEDEQGSVDVLAIENEHLGLERHHDVNQEARLFFNPRRQKRAELLQAITRRFWTTHPSILIDMEADRLTYRPFDLSRYHYHGSRLAHLEEWREFRSAGIRRNVLLQGPPGSGKTTLCCQAARELSRRTLIVSPNCIADISSHDWFDLLEMMKPEMVIVDDVDHIDAMCRYALQEKLRFFEEGYCNIPLVLFTSNDYSRLPEAIRRPGRIDQIIQFDEPSLEVRHAIIAKLAEQVGIDLPDERLPWLLTILKEYSPAHVLEALRRAKVRGWDALAREGDTTFRLHRNFANDSDWLRVHGFRQTFSEADFIFRDIFDRGETSVGYRDERCRLYRVVLPNGAEICIDRDSPYHGQNIYFRDDIDGRQKLCQGIAELFWQDRTAVLIDNMESKGAVCQTLHLGEHDYYGPLLEGIARWKKFRAAGMRRNILIQGPPGCGKSTFCLHVARELSQRTLMLTPDLYSMISFALWADILEFLQPQMVIIDDIDRVSEYALESKLRLFEEGYCEVPLVLFTSNDHHRLPEPMRRPGRIDQILEVDNPDKALRIKLIKELAGRVDVDVPQDEYDRLDAILQRQSNAHVIERLRRAKICGWNAPELPGDRTFPPPDLNPDPPQPEASLFHPPSPLDPAE